MRTRIRFLLTLGVSLAAIILSASQGARGQLGPLQDDVNGLVIDDGGPGDEDGRHNDAITFDVIDGDFHFTGTFLSQRGVYIFPKTYADIFFNISITALTDQADGYICFSHGFYSYLHDLDGHRGIEESFADNAADDADSVLYRGFLGPDRCAGENLGPPSMFDDSGDTFFGEFLAADVANTPPNFVSGRLDYHVSAAGDGVIVGGVVLGRGVPEPSSSAAVMLGCALQFGLRLRVNQRRYSQ